MGSVKVSPVTAWRTELDKVQITLSWVIDVQDNIDNDKKVWKGNKIQLEVDAGEDFQGFLTTIYKPLNFLGLQNYRKLSDVIYNSHVILFMFYDNNAKNFKRFITRLTSSYRGERIWLYNKS